MKPILTEYGPVDEGMRKQAAFNMRVDPAVKQRVEEMLIGKHGEKEGMKRAREEFREAYGFRKWWLDFKDKLGV